MVLNGFVNLTHQVTTNDPTTVNDASAQGEVGRLILHNGNLYRYVLFNNGAGNVASAAGGVAYWFALNPGAATPLWTVTSDQTDSIMGINGVAGVFGGVVTDGNHCFVQVGGRVNAQVVSTIAIGDLLVGQTTDLIFEEQNATYVANEAVFGVAITAHSGGFANVKLLNLAW